MCTTRLFDNDRDRQVVVSHPKVLHFLAATCGKYVSCFYPQAYLAAFFLQIVKVPILFLLDFRVNRTMFGINVST